MKNKTKAIILLTWVLSIVSITRISSQTIDLSGKWQFRSEREQGTVTLPGSMLTNGKGDPLSVDTRWTCSLYDSSFFFNPYMEKYRVEGKMTSARWTFLRRGPVGQ